MLYPWGDERGSNAGLVEYMSEHVLDIHHENHPDKAYDDLNNIGFTSHYKAMRRRFGAHMVDSAAGENIKRSLWPRASSG